MRYQSRRHQRLMDESEQALADAATGASARDARIAKHVLGDNKVHRLWEARHAELVRPVAETSKRVPQIMALRRIEVGLLHQRALIDYIRNNRVSGEERSRLFAEFYGPRETTDAMLMEHRRYMLAVSSRLSADHLLDLMQDPVTVALVKAYKRFFERYFELYCASVTTADRSTADATRLVMLDYRRRAEDIYQRIKTERPERRSIDFDREVELARSGRYPILDYMVG